MSIIVYGKENCPVCDRMKEFLTKRGIEYAYDHAEKYMEWHEGWREDGSIELKAFNELNGGLLPIVRIDGKLYGAEEAKAVIKGKEGVAA